MARPVLDLGRGRPSVCVRAVAHRVPHEYRFVAVPAVHGDRVGGMAVAVASFAMLAAAAFGADTRGLTWSAPVSLAGTPLTAVSCPSEQMCVAGGDLGVYVSTGPFEDPNSWKHVAAPT